MASRRGRALLLRRGPNRATTVRRAARRDPGHGGGRKLGKIAERHVAFAIAWKIVHLRPNRRTLCGPPARNRDRHAAADGFSPRDLRTGGATRLGRLFCVAWVRLSQALIEARKLGSNAARSPISRKAGIDTPKVETKSRPPTCSSIFHISSTTADVSRTALPTAQATP
jgi:hypothetical protein